MKAQTTRGVSKQAFGGMHRIARKEDIDKGGFYDSRLGAINIRCSPQDRAVGYGYEIESGALNYPGDYIATITPGRKKAKKRTVHLELQVDPERGGTELLGRRAESTSEELRWAREKLDDLVRRGEKEGVMEEVLGRALLLLKVRRKLKDVLTEFLLENTRKNPRKSAITLLNHFYPTHDITEESEFTILFFRWERRFSPW